MSDGKNPDGKDKKTDQSGKSEGKPSLPQLDVPTAADTATTGTYVRVEARPGETAEQLLRRFNREVQRAGIIKRLRELEFYEKPSKRKRQEEKIHRQIVRKFSKA